MYLNKSRLNTIISLQQEEYSNSVSQRCLLALRKLLDEFYNKTVKKGRANQWALYAAIKARHLLKEGETAIKKLAAICGRRWGKSEAAAYINCLKALEHPETHYLVLSLTLKQVGKILKRITQIVGPYEVLVNPLNPISKDMTIRFINGSTITGLSYEQVLKHEAARGDQYAGITCDEFAFARHHNKILRAILPTLAGFAHLTPEWWLILTTPQTNSFMREIMSWQEDPSCLLIRGQSTENETVRQSVMDAIEQLGGRDSGFVKQEYYGELLEDADRFVWPEKTIIQARKLGQRCTISDLYRRHEIREIIISIDPARGLETYKKESGNTGGYRRCNNGIIVMGLIAYTEHNTDNTIYQIGVLEDLTNTDLPEIWIRTVENKIDYIRQYYNVPIKLVIESNGVGKDIIFTIEGMIGHKVDIVSVYSSKDKVSRVEEAALLLYCIDRVAHYGDLPELEEEMRRFVRIPEELKEELCDRVDALAQGIKHIYLDNNVEAFFPRYAIPPRESADVNYGKFDNTTRFSYGMDK